MKKSTRLLKRFAALFLVMLMSIESFSAVVGDSDGAAFVNKKEFENLKNELNGQLDIYNDSLNGKQMARLLIGHRTIRLIYGAPVQQQIFL